MEEYIQLHPQVAGSTAALIWARRAKKYNERHAIGNETRARVAAITAVAENVAGGTHETPDAQNTDDTELPPEEIEENSSNLKESIVSTIPRTNSNESDITLLANSGGNLNNHGTDVGDANFSRQHPLVISDNYNTLSSVPPPVHRQPLNQDQPQYQNYEMQQMRQYQHGQYQPQPPPK